MEVVEDKHEDEMFLVSSDTESDYGDENYLFYDENSDTRKEIKDRLSAFDSDTGGMSEVYQERFLPKLKDKTPNFLTWLVDTDLLSSTVSCPNAESDPNCSQYMEYVFAFGLYDSYQLRCRNCLSKESIRKKSIFYGVKCNLRSAIRILYGWVKGVDLEVMSSMLGLDRNIIGTIYNRAAKIALSCLSVSPEFIEFGGENSVVLVDIYPNMLQCPNKLKTCRPILCIAEAESFPQRFWLQELDFWDPQDPEQISKVRKKIIFAITTLVRRGSTLILPNYESMPLPENIEVLKKKYATIRFMDELMKFASERRPVYPILDTIWKKPVSLCEEAQFYNPGYVSQFLIRNIWNEATGRDSFIMLIIFIVYVTRRKNIEDYL
ncbi:uncharacterized protein LOC115891922 [Sitophilus oryzae]|uniref:Uncharacterized protein LOC115891922 n=1 Tax=Sitophilus oryzae TaxID=7048 RepID=A0A6J2YZZ7_SITOR|nr:uncharacterized protein LOC115891922 [Sitophilus oryzae]